MTFGPTSVMYEILISSLWDSKLEASGVGSVVVVVLDTKVIVDSLKIGILKGFVEIWEIGSKVVLFGIEVES